MKLSDFRFVVVEDMYENSKRVGDRLVGAYTTYEAAWEGFTLLHDKGWGGLRIEELEP